MIQDGLRGGGGDVIYDLENVIVLIPDELLKLLSDVENERYSTTASTTRSLASDK